MKPSPIRELTRDAGIPGLGLVPDDWDSVAIRHLLEFENGQVDPRLKPYFNAVLVAPNHIESGTGVLLERETAAEQGAISGKYRVRAGDIIYSKIRPALRKVTVSEADCLCSADMYALRPIGKGESRFFFWSLLSDYFSRTVVLESDRVAMPKVNRESLGAIRLLRPPLDEQTQIAKFLDYETAKIDQLIDKQQQLIALLKEKRQAVISHAVTKGLNPDAPMKDSGVEWLGQVPAHWEIQKAAWHFQAEKGKNAQLLTKEYCGEHEGPFPVYSGQTANDGIMGRIETYEFDVGDDGVLFSTTVGAKAMHVAHLTGRFSLSQNCLIVRPRSRAYALRFAYYAFLVLFRFERLLIPDHMQASFRMEDFYQYRAVLPPREEQLQIAAFLDDHTSKLDTLMEKQLASVALLRERRTALISAAVTGKIDVRNWQPPESEAAQGVA